jgi:hypothetical protein
MVLCPHFNALCDTGLPASHAFDLPPSPRGLKRASTSYAHIFDSDHISEYLVRRHDPEDTFAVCTTDVAARNARAVMNGVMAAEVEVLLARRTGTDTSTLPRFDKLLARSAKASGGWSRTPTYSGRSPRTRVFTWSRCGTTWCSTRCFR